MTVLTRRTLLGAAPVALAGAVVVGKATTAQALEVSGGTLALVTPFRVLDTRDRTGGLKLGVGDAEGITIPDLAKVHGAVLNVTITDTEGTGYLRVADAVVWPPPTSTINWYADGQTVANLAIVHTHGEGKVVVQLGGRGGKAHVILDVLGYVT